MSDQPAVDTDYIDQEVAGILAVIRAANTPKAVELEVEERAERIRGELDPDSVQLEAE
jgi:hypothetical protein